jgi:hypothetical protein
MKKMWIILSNRWECKKWTNERWTVSDILVWWGLNCLKKNTGKPMKINAKYMYWLLSLKFQLCVK